MTDEQFKLFLEDNRKSTGDAIEKYVNGGIRALRKEVLDHNINHENDMKRILPVVEAFEESKAFNETTQRYGKNVIFYGKIVGSVGVIALAIKAFLLNK